MRYIAIILLAFAASLCASAKQVEVGHKAFVMDDSTFVIKAAELHYPRIPRQYWEHRIRMAKALGMNTVCMYVFWNVHEPREGEFDFSGQNDIAEFVRLAESNGMKVIVRPGPYVCAEWEMGGLPWWLLKHDDMALRTSAPRFMERVRRFEQEVGRQLAPYTADKGGPIIMVQVENEYGSYATDPDYVARIRDVVREAGFDKVPLFQCDWPSNFRENALPDLLWTLNFGTGADISEQFAPLVEVRPDSPLMCSEYWSGWFDKWGANHETRPADDMVAGLEEMLQRGISFSLYMTHGGTSFGHWAGANSPGYAPDVTSYDYDAPINEQGSPTAKYRLLRVMMQKYSDTPLPEPPDTIATFAVDSIVVRSYTPLLTSASAPDYKASPALTFEQMDMGWGAALYTAASPVTSADAVLSIECPNDYVQVFVDGEHRGAIDRVKGEHILALGSVAKGQRIDMLADAMGRINFGRAIADRKGIHGKISIDGTSLDTFDITLIPDDIFPAASDARPLLPGTSGYYTATFSLDSIPGDTWLDLSTWGKGQAWINGHPLGRFWSIGPQQTLYVPAPWLREGENRIDIVDYIGPRQTALRTLASPIYDMLQTPGTAAPEQRQPLAADETFAFTMSQEPAWQTLTLPSPRTISAFTVEIDDTYDGQPASIAEIYLTDSDGRRTDRAAWTLWSVSSQQTDGNHTADKAFDIQESTWWTATSLPASLTIKLTEPAEIGALQILPAAGASASGAPRTLRLHITYP